MDAGASEDQLADRQGRPGLAGDLDRGAGIVGGLASEDLVQDRVEAGLRDCAAADGGKELRYLIDRDGPKTGCLRRSASSSFRTESSAGAG